MGDALDLHLFEQSENGLDVNLCRREKRFAYRLAAKLVERRFDVRVFNIQNLAHKREAVGVNAAGGQGNDNVALGHLAVVDDLLLIDNAGAVAREVVFVLGVEAGHLGGLAADERGVGLNTALAHALYDVGNTLRHVLAAGDIVEEEQRLCTAADNVVHAHCHAVDADGVVLIHEEGDFELCAYAVGPGDQHGAGNAGEVKLEQSAEAAHVGADAGGYGSCDVLFHQLYRLVARGDVYAGGRVCVGSGFSIHQISS